MPSCFHRRINSRRHAFCASKAAALCIDERTKHTNMQTIQKVVAVLLVMMIPMTAVCGTAENMETHFTVQATESSEPHFTIETEDKLVAASGLSGKEWGKQASVQKEAGLSHPVTEEKLKQAAPHAQVFRKDGKIYMMQDLEGLASVRNAMDAYRTVYSLLPLLQGAEGTSLRLWSQLAMGTHQVYSFQQVFEGMTVPTSTAKLVVDQQGRLTAVFSSLSPVLPESTGTSVITASDAEDIVRRFLAYNKAADSVMPAYTTRTVISQDEHEDGEVLPDILAWIVYSHNPRFPDCTTVDLPYLAHFVSMDGTYLRYSAVAIPEDPALNAGYSAAYAFEFMEPTEWTGEVVAMDGSILSLSVPVMRDTRTGVWYLADPIRKIAVGEYSALAFGDGNIQLAAQTDNTAWNDEDLITYANMIRVWDFFAAAGWPGPDGNGTPVLLLRNMCTENGDPIYNAAYIGQCRGWQCFAYGGNAYIGQGLDVIAHEFTHCLTDRVMNTNLYQDDMGAINESMSDILGNLCEMLCENTRDPDWQIGESTGVTLRSMLNPHDHQQPEYIWDLYYAPHTIKPNDLNDRGGVHANSSILNYVAAHLCETYGMSLEDAGYLWMHAAFVLTPTTDFTQLSHVLPWVLKISGNSSFTKGLDQLIQHTRMAETKVPETLPEHQRIVSLKLPDAPVYRDGQWVMFAIQLNTESISNILQSIRDLAGHTIRMDLNSEEYFSHLSSLLHTLHLDASSILNYQLSESAIMEWLASLSEDIITYHTSWESNADHEIKLIVKDAPTLYVMAGYAENSEDVSGLAVLVGDEWFDPLNFFTSDSEAAETDDAGLITRIFCKLFEHILGGLGKTGSDAKSITLPSTGLEKVSMHEPAPEEIEYLPEDELNSVGFLPHNGQIGR